MSNLKKTNIAPGTSNCMQAIVKEKERQKIVECILPGSNTILKLPVPESIQPGHTFFVGRDDNGKVEQILIPVSGSEFQTVAQGQRPIAIKTTQTSQKHLVDGAGNKQKLFINQGNMTRVTSAIVLETRPQINSLSTPSNGGVINPIKLQQIKSSSENDIPRVLDLSKEEDIKSLLNIMKTSADKTGTPVTVNVKATPEQEKMLRRIISSGSITGSVRNTEQLSTEPTIKIPDKEMVNTTAVDKVKQIDELSVVCKLKFYDILLLCQFLFHNSE